MATGSLKGDLAVPGLFLGLKVGPTTSATTFTGGKYFHAGTGSPIAFMEQKKKRRSGDGAEQHFPQAASDREGCRESERERDEIGPHETARVMRRGCAAEMASSEKLPAGEAILRILGTRHRPGRG